MSLKMFHLVFVTALTLLSFLGSALKLRAYLGPEGGGADLALSLAAFAMGLAVIGYGVYVLRKLKHVSLL